MKPVDFTIISAPSYIALECPHCDGEIRIPWKKVFAPIYWGDSWPDVLCPVCGKTIKLGDFDYD